MVRTWKESKAAGDSLTENVTMGFVRTQKTSETMRDRGQQSENERQITLTVAIKHGHRLRRRVGHRLQKCAL